MTDALIDGPASARSTRARGIDVATAACELEGAPALDILQWASTQIPRLTFATGFGAEGCVIVDLIGRHALPIDVFTLDTGLLFPETYALWRQLEARYGITIRGVRPDQTLDEQAAAHGDKLWQREPDRCCQQRKVIPLVTWTHDDVWGPLYAHDVPYNPLHQRNYPSIGCQPCTSPVVPGENLRAGRWRGFHKNECG